MTPEERTKLRRELGRDLAKGGLMMVGVGASLIIALRVGYSITLSMIDVGLARVYAEVVGGLALCAVSVALYAVYRVIVRPNG